MKMPSYISSRAVRLVPMLAVAMFQISTLDVAFAAVVGKRVENSYSRPDTAEGRRAGLLVERPIDKPLPPVISGREGKGTGHDSSDRRWREVRHHDRDRRYYRRHKHGRYESPPIFRRGVVGPGPVKTGP